MPLDPKDIEAAVLSPEPSAHLADCEDDDEILDPAEAERLWIEEAERRYQEFLAGGIELIPAAQVIAEIRAQLRSR